MKPEVVVLGVAALGVAAVMAGSAVSGSAPTEALTIAKESIVPIGGTKMVGLPASVAHEAPLETLELIGELRSTSFLTGPGRRGLDCIVTADGTGSTVGCHDDSDIPPTGGVTFGLGDDETKTGYAIFPASVRVRSASAAAGAVLVKKNVVMFAGVPAGVQAIAVQTQRGRLTVALPDPEVQLG